MVDYSRWDHIEVSDDEDDTHPNIDTPSLFRWRHQARVERMEEMKNERKAMDAKLTEKKKELEEMREKLKNAAISEKEGITTQLEKADNDMKELKKKDEELTKKEKKAPKNVDTLSHEGFTKTIINKSKPKEDKPLSPEEEEKRSKEFMDKYEKEIKHFGMLHDYVDSKDYLIKHPYLTCDDTANYLALWCINLQVQEHLREDMLICMTLKQRIYSQEDMWSEKESLMERVAHQCIIIQYILELAKQLHSNPKATVPSFFTKIVRAKSEYPEYMEAFNDELESFKKRVRERAKARIEKAMKEAEEEERQERLGPGGLDPVEVFQSLPKELQECFDKKDVGLLQEVLGKMPEEEARDWLKKCIDSGLWIPNAAEEAKAEAEGSGTGAVVDEEKTYEEVKDAANSE